MRFRMSTAVDALRRITRRFRRAGLAAAGIAICEIGARVGLPGVDQQVVNDVAGQRTGPSLLWLYDGLVGGALSRGAILALGIVPYLSAKIFMRLARVSFPGVAEMWAADDGPARVRRWTRIITAALALIQSYGFARFVQTIPGAVAEPGAQFIAQTMLVLTTVALLIMWVSERITAPDDDVEGEQAAGRVVEARVAFPDAGAAAVASGSDEGLLLGPAPFEEADLIRPREKVTQSRP
jgi:preprotein translocase subunit SecY